MRRREQSYDQRFRSSPKPLASEESQWPPLYTSPMGASLTVSLEALGSMETVESGDALALDASPPQASRLASGFPQYVLQTSSIIGGAPAGSGGRAW